MHKLRNIHTTEYHPTIKNKLQIHNNTDESQNNMLRERSQTQEYILYSHISIKFQKTKTEL